MIARRLITIPLLLILTALGTVLFPVLLIVAWLLSLLPLTRGAVATLCFLLGYLWCETIGVLVCCYIWLRYRDRDRFLRANYRLQAWWTTALKSLADRLFRLRFDISGEDALTGPAAIVIPRHTSTADTIIPMACYAVPRGLRIRYILKRELVLDPCLDIVGHRLPNLFIERSGANSDQAKAKVAALVQDLAEDEGALIYPEGTRFSPEKHASLRRKRRSSPEQMEQLDRWTHLLPPRLGGTMAMLTANPGKDVLFCAHTGFEGSSHFSNLINGSWISAHVKIQFWRVPFAEIPKEPDALQDWLFAQWDTMQDWVARNQPAHQ